MPKFHQRTTVLTAGVVFAFGWASPLPCGASTPNPAKATPVSVFPDEEDPWDSIRKFLEFICQILPCAGSHSSRAMPADVANGINTVVLSYATNGLNPNLTEAERQMGLDAVLNARDWVETHPGWIDEPGLEFDFLQTLEAMKEDLEPPGQ